MRGGEAASGSRPTRCASSVDLNRSPFLRKWEKLVRPKCAFPIYLQLDIKVGKQTSIICTRAFGCFCQSTYSPPEEDFLLCTVGPINFTEIATSLQSERTIKRSSEMGATTVRFADIGQVPNERNAGRHFSGPASRNGKQTFRAAPSSTFMFFARPYRDGTEKSDFPTQNKHRFPPKRGVLPVLDARCLSCHVSPILAEVDRRQARMTRKQSREAGQPCVCLDPPDRTGVQLSFGNRERVRECTKAKLKRPMKKSETGLT